MMQRWTMLAISIVFSGMFVMACDDNLSDNPPTPPGAVFGGDESSSIATSLFKSAAQGAASQVGGTAATWVMGSLGLSNGSPDYTAQLDKIDADLQVIITELDDIKQELNEIKAELTVINCSEWASTLSSQKGRIDNLMSLYSTYVSTASTGGIVSNATLADWVDQVLAQGSYSSHAPMGEILAEIADQLYVPPSSGVIPACVQAITPPAENTFGTDADYYTAVKLYTDYYYSYQVRGLLLLNEALHYQAWVAAGSPNSDSLSADATSSVCQDANAVLYCNESAAAVNNLYNALLQQLTAGGAPYSDEDFVLMYKSDTPYLWPLSLEDFTTAAGDNCAHPLTSAQPCGVTAGWYNVASPMNTVVYKGHTGWQKAGSVILAWLLEGFNSGTIGDSLENAYGFQNMKNKIIISSNTVSIELDHTHKYQDFVTFFDTNFDHSFMKGLVQTYDQYSKISRYTEHYDGSGNKCNKNRENGHYYIYKENTDLSNLYNHFYDLTGRIDFYWDNNVCEGFQWLDGGEPGWLAANKGSNAKQYSWPVGLVYKFPCRENRSAHNPGGVWTTCGDDFTAWFDYYVPRPETCDNPGAGITCSLDAETIASARAER